MTRGKTEIRGWCPDAWRPMAAGDGLLVRVRPSLGRMSVSDTLRLCEASLIYGNGLIDLTNRAGLQLRGLREGDWSALVSALIDSGLVHADPEFEARRLLVLDPGWRADDDSHRIAAELIARLAEFPRLPAKMGFAVDAGIAPVLMDISADFRIESASGGGLMLRLDGRPTGARLVEGGEVAALLALSRWFVDSGGVAAGRAGRHSAPLPDWADDGSQPAARGERWEPGDHELGAVFGLPFGRIDARRLASLVERPGATAVRLSPWRMLLVEGLVSEPADGLISDPASPLIWVDACAGAPRCPQATVDTRIAAGRIAPLLGGRRLHVSGCAKGCAQPLATSIVATGRGGLFDLAFDARAGDAPVEAGLDPDNLIACLEGK